MDKSFFYARLHIGRELSISMKLFVLFILIVVETLACNMKQENFSSLLSIRYCAFLQSKWFALFYKMANQNADIVSLAGIGKFRDTILASVANDQDL